MMKRFEKVTMNHCMIKNKYTYFRKVFKTNLKLKHLL